MRFVDAGMRMIKGMTGKKRAVECAVILGMLVLAWVGAMGPAETAEAATKVSEGNTFIAADGNTYTYTLYDDDTARITFCDAANPVIVVPEVVDGYSVTGLGISGHTSKMIPNSVTEITSLYINAPYIQSFAFATSGLHIGTLTIGEDVISYGISIFSGNTIDVMNYNALNASNSGTGSPLGAGGLQANPATVIGHLNIGDNVQKIPGHMFCNVTLEQDELEIHAASIGSYAFESHGIHIGNFTLTDDVKSCGYFVTSYSAIDVFNYNITDMTYTQSLNSIFGGGSGATTTTHIGRINVGSNVKSIPEMAFQYIALDQDELVLDVERIGSEAFQGKDIHIGRLVIGKDVTKFGYGVTAKADIGILDYNAERATGSSAYGVFGPAYAGGGYPTVGTVNIGDGVKSIPKGCFEYMTIGTVNYDAAASGYQGSGYFGMFRKSVIGQFGFGDGVTAIPAYMLKDASVGNTDVVVPESVTSIGSQWITDVTAENLENVYVYANTKASSPEYVSTEYPNLYIHRGSGFYDYFTNTNNGSVHQGMELHLLCDDHMGDVEYGDDNGITDGCRHRDCTVCGHAFDKEYLIKLTAGSGIESVSGGGYYVEGTTVDIDCTVADGMVFSGWTDTVEDEVISASKALSYDVGSKARSLRADAGKETFTVTFADDDGTVLDEQEVESGDAAVEPVLADRTGYIRSWDKDFSAVTEDMTVTAVYAAREFTVRFLDHDGTVLKSETVEYGEDATPPEDDPEWDGHEFVGWDRSYESITDDLTVKALYDVLKFTVTFKDGGGYILKNETVEYGEDATPPDDEDMELSGCDFTGWDGDYTNVTENRILTAQYEPWTFTVTFEDWDGAVLKEQTILYGEDATAPEDPEREGYLFDGWDGAFTGVTEDITVRAVYRENGGGGSGGGEPEPGPGSEPEPEPEPEPSPQPQPQPDPDPGPPLPPPSPEPGPVPEPQPVRPGGEDDEDDDEDDDGDGLPQESHGDDNEDSSRPLGMTEEDDGMTGEDDGGGMAEDDGGNEDDGFPREMPVDEGEDSSRPLGMTEDDDGMTGDGDKDEDDGDGETDEDGGTGDKKPGIPPVIPIGVGGGAGAGVWYFFWWRRRRKIRGSIMDKEGNPVEGLRVVLSGRSVHEAVTDKNGDYAFKRVQDDVLEYYVYDGAGGSILVLEIASKERETEDIFEVVESAGCDVEYDKSGKSLFVDVAVPVDVRDTLILDKDDGEGGKGSL